MSSQIKGGAFTMSPENHRASIYRGGAKVVETICPGGKVNILCLLNFCVNLKIKIYLFLRSVP